MRHAAKLENSERLQKVLALISDGGWHGTYSIMSKTNLCAVGSAISELRANGKGIESRCIGHGKHEYRLIKNGLGILKGKARTVRPPWLGDP